MVDANSLIPKQIVVPTAWLASFIIGGVAHTGMMYQQFQTLREESKERAAILMEVRDSQRDNASAINALRSDVDRHDGRIVVIERVLIGASRGGR